MKTNSNRRDRNRDAILDALARVMAETGGKDFSIQRVADRAGVTHRTVYNHFPTREALRDGLAVRVEEQLAETRLPPDRTAITAANIVAIGTEAFARFEEREAPIRAYALHQVASRGAAGVARKRTAAIRKAIEAAGPLRAPVSSEAVAAAVRMFFSAVGWHLLTEHYGLSSKEASATASWATETLLKAATRKAS